MADGQSIPGLREDLGEHVHPRLWCEVRLGGGSQDGLGVLVHADDEANVIATQTAVAGDRIGTDLLERVAQVGVAVRVVDGCRDVKLGHRLGPQLFRARLRASAVSPLSSSRLRVRSSPDAPLSVTRFAKMFTDSTFSVPVRVRTSRPCFGKRLRACT